MRNQEKKEKKVISVEKNYTELTEEQLEEVNGGGHRDGKAQSQGVFKIYFQLIFLQNAYCNFHQLNSVFSAIRLRSV